MKDGAEMLLLKEFFQKEAIKKFIVLLFIILFFYLIRDVINLVLFTFIFTYLAYSMQCYIHKIIPVKKVFITIAIYTVLFLIIAFVMYKYIPIMINQVIAIINQIIYFDYDYSSNRILNYGYEMVKDIDIANNLKEGSDSLLLLATNAGKVSFNIFISLLLSLFFILEKDEIINFMRKFERSKAAGAYRYIKYFGRNFLNSFGKVMKAQILIACINAILSVVALKFMGFHQLLGLGLMIFTLGLIPVAGVIISLIPLSIIAFKIGGIMKVISVLIMVAVLHALEGYILNPKFMSVNTKLPVFFTFVILIVSEHYMGVWGLLLGIPLFMFVLDLLDVNLVEKK